METMKDDDKVILNLKLLKGSHIYNMFDPSTTKTYKWNVYLILAVLLNAVTLCVVTYGNIGFIFGYAYSMSIVDIFLVVFISNLFYHTLVMITRTLKKRNEYWNILSVTKFNFLKSKICALNIGILHQYRSRSIQITYFYFALYSNVIILWVIYPIIQNSFTGHKEDSRIKTIVNFPFPVELNTYNNYYYFFVMLEMFVAFSVYYNMLVPELLLISVFYALIGQYKVIAKSFQSIGLEEKTQTEYYSDFISILGDQQKLEQKLKIYYSVVRPIILMNITLNCIQLTTLTYTLVSVILSTKSFLIFDVLRLLTTNVYGYMRIFAQCYIFEHLGTEINSINFAMYSCDWTRMNLKFKKLLLLTMRVNSCNKSEMKFSLNKIVNLQLFASFVSTSYNIVSVLIKTIDN